jgi:hypothetical protein
MINSTSSSGRSTPAQHVQGNTAPVITDMIDFTNQLPSPHTINHK